MDFGKGDSDFLILMSVIIVFLFVVFVLTPLSSLGILCIVIIK